MTERSGQIQAGRSRQGYVSASESRMSTRIDQIDLDCLRKAQRGCKESRSLLAKQANCINVQWKFFVVFSRVHWIRCYIFSLRINPLYINTYSVMVFWGWVDIGLLGCSPVVVVLRVTFGPFCASSVTLSQLLFSVVLHATFQLLPTCSRLRTIESATAWLRQF